MYTNTMKKLLFITYAIAHLLIGASANAAPSEETTFFHTDALGSIIAASDEQGDVIWRKTYDPYGNEVISTETGEEFEGQAYTGKPYDRETGLVYLSQRYYDPELRRFMSIDPVGFRVDAPVSFNRYAYANNNPYKFVDPDGRQSVGMFTFTSCVGAGRNTADCSNLQSEIIESESDGVIKGSTTVAAFASGGALAAYAGTAKAFYYANAYRFNQAGLFGGELLSPVSIAGSGGILAAKGGGEVFDLALGLGRHDGSGSQLLRNFARHTGSKTYGDIYGYFPVQNNIFNAIRDAKTINFNLDQFSLSRFKSFLSNPKYGDDNITNWELHTILSNPSFLNKTTFYGPGGVKVAAPIID